LSHICFLFDLDGTLVLTGGAGLRAFDTAFREVFQVDGRIATASPAGKTDPDILRRVCLEFLGREPTPDEERSVYALYLEQLRMEVAASPDFEIMPGIVALLKWLEADERCLVGLGTGNLEQGAEIKLTRPDLWRFFRFGGFGSDATERSELLAIAMERGRALLENGQAIDEVYVIGDTPRDVSAGRAIGARTVGVATGPYSVEDLEKAGADLVYPDLSDYEAFLSDTGLR
jgi:phosphoglycolate phosphatase-like HAD superfamily hydrolase